MNYLNIVSKFTNPFETRYVGIALAALLSAAMSSPANADETWKVDMARSHFSAKSNTLVLHRNYGKASTESTNAQGKPTTGTFVVISDGKVYLATDEAATDATSCTTAKTVDYARWRGMKLVQIGENVRPIGYCGFECQSGFPSNHLTLAFTAKGIDVSGRMSDVAVLNTR